MSAHAHLPALAAVAARLRCPHCGGSLKAGDRVLSCARGHSYDVARRGHVTLQAPRGKPAPGDTAAMVGARETFLSAGHYAPVAQAIAAAAADAAGPLACEEGCVVDLGAGTGYYLAALLGALARWRALALDASRPALRTAVRAHPRIAAVACDLWQPLPLQDATADLVLNVFAPHNARETARILSGRGTLIVVTPAPEHLHQLVSTIGTISVDPNKQVRLYSKLSPDLRAVDRRRVEFEMTLSHDDVHALVEMGPSAHHLSAHDVSRRLLGAPERIRVTASVVVEAFRPVAP
jgi:23S rRNA (guanine745-N1)-methyltransferase